MSKLIPTESFTTPLFALLDETFEKVQGIFLDGGTSLFETLEGISAEDASRPVAPGRPTIAAQVDHVRFYLDVLERYMRGESVGKIDWKEIWNTVDRVSPEEWQTIRDRLRASHSRVTALMKSFDGWDGENEIGGALAIVVHTAYHLGQIRLTARANGG
jgi:hypothetical protein